MQFGKVLNIMLFILTLGMLGVSGWYTWQGTHVRHQVAHSELKIADQQKQLQEQQQKNHAVIYLPQNNELKLSSSQSASVRWLSGYFSSVTNYSTLAQYQSDYQKAQTSISDPRFFKQFLNKPSAIRDLSLFLYNVQTQVLILGPDRYEVLVSYVPYHNGSDLNQVDNLQTVTKALIMQGTAGHYSQAYVDPQLITDGSFSKASDFN